MKKYKMIIRMYIQDTQKMDTSGSGGDAWEDVYLIVTKNQIKELIESNTIISGIVVKMLDKINKKI